MLLLFICLVVGFLLQKIPQLRVHAPHRLNQFVLYISLPAIILLKTRDIPISSEAIVPIVMPVLTFALSFLVFYFWGKTHDWSRGKIGATILLAGLGNTSFIGFPLIKAFYGEDYITYGLMVDQGGSFITVSSFGLIVASVFSGNRVQVKAILKKIFLFPTTVAFFLALACLHWDYPESLKSVFSSLGSLLGPVAMLAIGLQLSLGQLKHFKNEIYSIISFKMILTPLLYLGVAWAFFEIKKPVIQITLFESLMPPMITAGIIAQEYGLEPKMAPNIVGVGILLAFVLAPLWYFLLQMSLPSFH